MEFLKYLTPFNNAPAIQQQLFVAVCAIYGVYILSPASVFAKPFHAASLALGVVILYGLAEAPRTAVLTLFTCMFLYGMYAKMVFHTWEKHFAG